MGNSCKSKIHASERNFGHSIVNWEIKSCSRALWQKNYNIETPEFSIKGPNSLETKWKFVIETESTKSLFEKLNISVTYREKESNFDGMLQKLSNVDIQRVGREGENVEFDNRCFDTKNGESNLSLKTLMLYLKRGKADEGPYRVFVNWKVYYTSIKGKNVLLGQDEQFFNKNFKYGFNIGAIYDLERDFECNPSTLRLYCDILVTDTDENEIFDDELSIHLYGLSEDLQWIFNQQKFCDVDIKVHGKTIKAHKAMLYSHSKSSECSDEVPDCFELSTIKYTELLKVLEYIYSHDLNVLEKPSISTYDCATQMNVIDLVGHYVPEKINIQTNIDMNELRYRWIIDEFTKQLDCLSSPVFKTPDDIAWQINLYPLGTNGSNEYVAVRLECIEGNISDDLCIHVAVLGNNESIDFCKIFQKDEEDHAFVKDERFILRENVIKLLNEGSLHMELKVITFRGNDSSVVNEPCTPISLSMKQSFETMKNNLLFLRQCKKYTDITFNFGKEEIKAHKFILSARSLYFLRQFEENDDMSLSDISPEIFNILLDYIYCASFNVQDIDKVIEVYKASEEFIIPRLQEICSRFLQNNIDISNYSCILRLADEYYDTYLKEIAEQFIDANKNMLKQQVLMKTDSESVLLNKNETVTEYNDAPSASKIKSLSILKYNENSLVSYDFKLVQSSLNGNPYLTEVIYKNLPDKSTEGNTLAHNIDVRNQNDVHMKEEKKTMETNSAVGSIDNNNKIAQSEQSKVQSKTRCSNGIDLPYCNEGMKEIKQIQLDKEVLCNNGSINRLRKETNPPSERAHKEDISLATSEMDISERREEIHQIIKDGLKKLNRNTEDRTEEMHRTKEEIDTIKALYMLHGNVEEFIE